jgi:hypothetical protein
VVVVVVVIAANLFFITNSLRSLSSLRFLIVEILNGILYAIPAAYYHGTNKQTNKRQCRLEFLTLLQINKQTKNSY